ncbi:RNA-directed DNA polymerase [Candidatus Dojkabacteria bacterium]|nr:RNA-directed DNA polymerase [Candidatus Dojkabacteria bacterium]
MSKAEFIDICKDKKFWKWIRENSPKKYPSISDKDNFLTGLYKKISNRTYYPNPPEEYITINKGCGILRVIPALNLEDLCVYYFCARKLEKYIAVNRVSGTFGGFGLSGKLRQIEENEVKGLRNQFDIITIGDAQYVFKEINGYMNLSSLNPKAWFAEWGDFTNKLYFTCSKYQEGFVAELDISNFYDSIQLDNLEYKLRKYVPHSCNDVIYLVSHFLKFWNRHINFYRQQGAGIPQDTFGECSRILANFYLQSYDKQISDFCKKKDAEFFRYADDQIIFADSKEVLEEIVAKASSFLMREGLNFNQKKIKIMTIKEFKKYYAFENFLKLAQKNAKKIDLTILERQINYYLRNSNKLKKSGLSLLRRIIKVLNNINKKPKNFSNLKKYILSKFIVGNYLVSTGDLNKIFNILSKSEKNKMIKLLDISIESSWYTDHLYNLKSFYRLHNIPVRKIGMRITFLKKFYNFQKTN